MPARGESRRPLQRTARCPGRGRSSAGSTSWPPTCGRDALTRARADPGLRRLFYNYRCAQQAPRRRHCRPARLLRLLGRRPRPGSGQPGGTPARDRETGGVGWSRAGPADRVRGSGRGSDRSALPRPCGTRASRSRARSRPDCLRAGLRRARDGARHGRASGRARVGRVQPDRCLRDRPLAAQRRAARGAGCGPRRSVATERRDDVSDEPARRCGRPEY
jgi:hypothetical protein